MATFANTVLWTFQQWKCALDSEAGSSLWQTQNLTNSLREDTEFVHNIDYTVGCIGYTGRSLLDRNLQPAHMMLHTAALSVHTLRVDNNLGFVWVGSLERTGWRLVFEMFGFPDRGHLDKPRLERMRGLVLLHTLVLVDCWNSFEVVERGNQQHRAAW